MLYNHCKPIIFLLNNKEYTIEKYLNVTEKQTHYNDLPLWDYSKIIEAFGSDYYTSKVYTNRELDEAINQAEVKCNEKLCFIEIYVAQMDTPIIVHEITNLLKQMEKQK